MEDYELSDKKLQEWLDDGKEQIIYTFDDWLNEKPFPNEYWFIDKEKSKKVGEEVLTEHSDQIFESLEWAWKFALEVEIDNKIALLKYNISNIENIKDKYAYLTEEKNKLILDYEKSSFSRKDFIFKRPPSDIMNIIDAEKFKKIKESSDNGRYGYKTRVIENEYFNALINLEVMNYIDLEIEKLDNPEQSEKLEHLNHKLCILEDLGILDLIDEKFNYKKGYSGGAPVKDKARLIASLLDIEDYKRVQYALKNKEFKSDKQIKNACETLKNHGLQPFNFID